MSLHLIELTEKDGNRKIIVNLSQVTYIMQFRDCARVCFSSENDYIEVEEGLYDIKNKLKSQRKGDTE